jgi:hypothetical protein
MVDAAASTVLILSDVVRIHLNRFDSLHALGLGHIEMKMRRMDSCMICPSI